MFDFLKPRIQPEQFGAQLVPYVAEFLYSDADRSLGTCFDDYDASNGWVPYFHGIGISDDVVKINRYFYMHCAIQGACARFNQSTRKSITLGAMGLFKQIDGYNVNHNISDLENIYANRANWTKSVDHLDNPRAIAFWLPNGLQDVAIKGSRYILNLVVRHVISPREITQELFELHSTTLLASTATTNRAFDELLKTHKLG